MPVVVNVACALRRLLLATETVPRVVDVVVSANVTVPVGPAVSDRTPLKGLVKLATSWSADPELICVAPAERVSVRANGFTVTATGPVVVLALNVPSPAYDAVRL